MPGFPSTAPRPSEMPTVFVHFHTELPSVGLPENGGLVVILDECCGSVLSAHAIRVLPPATCCQPELVEDVDSQGSFKMFDAGWILPTGQKRGGKPGARY